MHKIVKALFIWACCEALYIYTNQTTYKKTYAMMSRVQINTTYVLLSYIGLITGLVCLVTNFKSGIIYGLAIYGVFNFTNGALFPLFDSTLAMQDLAWGIFACGLYGFALERLK